MEMGDYKTIQMIPLPIGCAGMEVLRLADAIRGPGEFGSTHCLPLPKF
jgi:hypothetical protein